MKHTLLLRLKGPMQSWGVSSRFSIRDTGKEPSKSGVIGLLCAALGISREDANRDNPLFCDLLRLKMSVRVLSEGVMQKDYHTAQNIAKADGGIKDTELSTRWYLADADFLVGLDSDELQLLTQLQVALKRPKWQLFLGRKSFVPSEPIHFPENGIQTGEVALQNVEIYSKQKEQRLVIEDENGPEVRQDVPLDFATRRFSIRRVRTEFIKPKGAENDDADFSDENGTESEMSAGQA